MKKEKILVIAVAILLGVLIIIRIKQINEASRKCDIARGYTCSSYEVQEFMRGEN